MSADSGGGLQPRTILAMDAPQSLPEAVGRATRSTVCRKKDVEIVCAHPVEAKSVVRAVVSIVQPPQLLEGLQQINPRKYIVSFKSITGAEYFLGVASKLNIPETTIAYKWLGAEFKKIKVAFLPLAVSNDELAAVLGRYGRVLQVAEELHQNTPIPLKTGTRIVDMEMNTPVPNLITVCGFTVPVTYRGVVMQCRRCLLTGHMKVDCRTPYCDRCSSFGHGEDSCVAPCLKCKSPGHHWRNCAVRSYAFATAAFVGKSGAAEATVESAEEMMSAAMQQQAVNNTAGRKGQTTAAGEASTEGFAAVGTFETRAKESVTDGAKNALLRTEVSAKCRDDADAMEVNTTSFDMGVQAETSNGTTSVAEGVCDDVTGTEAAAIVSVTCTDGAASVGATDCNTSACNSDSHEKAVSGAMEIGNVKANPVPVRVTGQPGVNHEGHISEECYSGEVDKAKTASNHLQWKTAITRSKRKLLVGTPGRSPCLKKSATEKILDEKS